MSAPQDRLAAALMPSREHHANCRTQTGGDCNCWFTKDQANTLWRAGVILDRDPTIAADMELGRRIRDASDPLLKRAIETAYEPESGTIAKLRAALTEGEK